MIWWVMSLTPPGERRRRRPAVVVVGSINADLVLRMERLPQAGETVAGGTFERHGGGKGANQAVAAARAGAEVVFVGAVGEDDFGQEAVAELRAEQIDVSGIVRLPGVSTGVAAVVVDAGGENQIAVASGANAELDVRTIERRLSAAELPADAVCLLNLEIPDPPLLAAAQCARAAGIETILVNPAPARALPQALLELGPILTPNSGELALLAGTSSHEAADPGSVETRAQELHALSGAPVIVTLGEHGARMLDGTDSRAFPAPSLRAVDATGAGDAFNGALAASLAQGWELPRAIERAVAAASCSVGSPGARGGMPTREEIDHLVAGSPGAPDH